MATLHLIQPWHPGLRGREDLSDAGVLACRAHVLTQRQDRCDICVLGPSDALRRARLLGLTPAGEVSPPLGRTRYARRGVRRFMNRRGPFDKLVLWSGGLEPCAADANIETLSRAHAAVDEAGLNALAAGLRAEQNREQLRAALGLPADRRVIALACDPPSAGDLHLFISMLGLLEQAAFSIAALVPRGTSGTARGWRMHKALHLATPVRVTEAPLATCLRACDIAVAAHAEGETARTAPTLLARLAAAMDIPTVAALDPSLPPAPNLISATENSVTGLGREVLKILQGRRPA